MGLKNKLIPKYDRTKLNLMPHRVMMGAGAGEVFSVATGGTITTDGDYKVHKFTSSGTFTITQLGTDEVVEYLVVAGGGAGGGFNAGGGGAGGL